MMLRSGLRHLTGFVVAWISAHTVGLDGNLWWRVIFWLMSLGLAWECLVDGIRHRGTCPVKIDLASLMRHAHRHPQQLWLGWGASWNGEKLQQHVDRLGTAAHKRRALVRKMLLSAEGRGHMLVIGAPGTGKTQLLLWLAAQAVGRGEAVIMIDPKGGGRIPDILRACASRRGVPCYELRLDQPSLSCHLDVLAHGQSPSELATRLCRLLPAAEQAEVFARFSWMVLYRILSGLMMLERPYSWGMLRAHVMNQGQDLARACAASGGAQHAVTQGLAALARHDATHYSKMIVGMMPLLEILATGVLGELLSISPHVERVCLGQVVAQRAVLYVSLAALEDSQVARVLGSLVLGELSSWVGARYGQSGLPELPLQVMVDEASEVSGVAFVQLLNKGREAGVQMCLSVQTLADLEVAMQGESEARMMVGNATHVLMFRTLDPASRRALIERAGWVSVRGRLTGASLHEAGLTQGQRRGVTLQHPWQDMALVSDQDLSELEDMQYVAHLGGRGLVWGALARVGKH